MIPVIQLTHPPPADRNDPDAVRVALLQDGEAYRKLALTAIERLHHMTIEHDRLKAAYQRLIGEFRRWRAQHAGMAP